MPRLVRFLLLLAIWISFGTTLVVWGVTRTKYISARVSVAPARCGISGLAEGYCLIVRPGSGATGLPRWGFSVREHHRVSMYEQSIQYSLAKPFLGYRFWTSGSGRVYIAWVSYPAALVTLLLLLATFLPWRRLFSKNLAALPDVLFDENCNVVD